MNENQEQDAPKVYWRVEEWFPDLSPETKTSLRTYHEELIKYSRTINLISAKTVFVADALHFADSILASNVIMSNQKDLKRIHDFGSGAGFPGLILAILYPQVQVVLLEGDQKKCEFLNHMVATLKLKNASVECKPVESLGENSVQHAIARGFSNISRTIMAARKCMVKGGSFYHLKGEEWGMEVSEIPTQLCSIWSPSLIGEYKLPVGAVKFAVVKTEKIA